MPESYAHGDHIKCPTCSTQHKVQRGDVLRLVIADVAPLKESLHDNRRRVDSLEAELRDARGSFGIGVNGLGIGLIYLLWQVTREGAALAGPIFFESAGVAIGVGILLEVANYFFLAKRQRMNALSAEIEELRGEGRQIQQRIREALRG